MRRTIAATAVAVLALSLHAAPVAAAADSASSLRAYLRHSLGSTTEVEFRAAETDLNADGKREIVIYVASPEYCGSGGCLTLVLAREGGAYRTMMTATVTRPPIRVLDTKHHGWKDIGVMVGGGGIGSPYEAAMPFDGRRYPSNPTTPPARRLGHETGLVLIK